MKGMLRRIKAEVDPRGAWRGMLAFGPVAAVAGRFAPDGLCAVIMCIGLFVSLERSSLAPSGVLLLGALMFGTSMAACAAVANPVQFIACTTCLAAAMTLLSARFAAIRTVCTLIFVVSVYLPLELSAQTSPAAALGAYMLISGLLGFALAVTLALSIVDHSRRERVSSLVRHWARFRHADDRLAPQSDTVLWMFAIIVGIGVATAIVETMHVRHGEWMIWSAASVFTGDFPSAGRRIRDRTTGALLGVPAGMLMSHYVVSSTWLSVCLSLGAALTIVSFRRYVVGFGLRCALITLDLSVTTHSLPSGLERGVNVVSGCLLGGLSLFGARLCARMFTSIPQYVNRDATDSDDGKGS